MPETQTAPKDGAALITEERRRQIEAEGWTAEHDDGWGYNQLTCAAVNYAMEGVTRSQANAEMIAAMWPWGVQWWKPKDRIRNLVKAGALIAAEIDRLLRAEMRGTQP